MITKNYNVVGVMSGTSLDGTDLAHITLTCTDNIWSFKIHEAETIAYTDDWVNILKSAIDYDMAALEQLNKEYTELLAGIIDQFITKHDIKNLDAVCSHGHTILHRPQDGITLQIGNLPEIAQLTQQTVVCDFRVQDVQLGGQGAPLVPIGDRLLFADYTYCLNLGGFSNISFEENGIRAAFDICPVNTVLNFYANKLGLPYDDGGKIANSGKLIPQMAKELDILDFYAAPYPKSLGFEFVKQTVLPLIEKYPESNEDKLHTFTIHVAKQIANSIRQQGQKGSLLVTGGGAYNAFLIDVLQSYLPDTIITVPDDKTIQFKEALIFALLGVLKLSGKVNVLGSVTGAKKDHSSGIVHTL
ncbi:anhydro-N-acetylmuramic acid kinase [Flavobacterium zepuense]|uniref:Anhydro-N-acetylmuramic acid kinase n=1 Tax=Flavobacterium zepuense TaxID=2593302 RepID=A0A552V4G8_9FLAO|nr:anhydro-N-acetylmuramic acid kinase [Flavobacterium zepuense]TRW25380.1 anhydro-N-acetylmuramic acid kinase [Flavobacterium zepuense]